MTEQVPSDELLKCPFCGWEAERYQNSDDEFSHFVKCSNCAAQTDFYMTEEHAVSRWNMRVPSHE